MKLNSLGKGVVPFSSDAALSCAILTWFNSLNRKNTFQGNPLFLGGSRKLKSLKTASLNLLGNGTQVSCEVGAGHTHNITEQ